MKTAISCFVIFILITGCKERYNPPVSSPKTGYLVVEGFINNGRQPTIINLSRTVQLEDIISTTNETDAQVSIEGDNGDAYPLHQSGVGEYSSDSITLKPSATYRLHIVTVDGRVYASDYTPVKSAPPIDSISWQRNSNNLQLYVNTYDPQNITKYYQWEYEETWEYHSAYLSNLIYLRDSLSNVITGLDYWNPFTLSPNYSIYTCWHTTQSTSILLGSTEKLSSSIVHYPILQIQQGDQRISVLYHIRVKQTALSSAKYQFLQRMKKNTETLGSIFDAQPSQLNTNLHCLSNPGEQVIGYMEVSQEQEKTLFIKNSEVPDWRYNAGCANYVIFNNLDTILSKGAGLYPTSPASAQGNTIITFNASTPECVDCTLTGSNIKPSFWP